MKKGLLVVLVLSLFVSLLNAQIGDQVSYDEQKSYQIGGISVEGAVYNDQNAIIAVSGLTVDQKITIPGLEITKAVKSLWRMKLFTDVQVHLSKVMEDVAFLTIRVVEKPRLSRYSYRGVPKTLHEDLNAEVGRFLLRGGIVTESVKLNGSNALKEYFIGKGFLDTEIDVLELKDSLLVNSVRLVFDIEKKKKVRIGDIIINGNDAVAEGKVRRKMKNTKRRANLFKGSKYIKQDYKEDLVSVVQYYNNIGYRDARVVRDSVYRNGKDLEIALDLEEGNQYYFGDITFKGNSIYETDRLQRIMGIEEGDVYNESLLQSRLSFSADGRDVTSLYMDNGYLFFRADPVEVNVESDTIDLEIRIFEGPQATIDQVVIKGNDRTHEHVIRRELRTKPGEKFSRSEIIRSQREILALGYFNQENLGINTPVNAQRGTVDIEYVVEERPSDQLELSAGWGGQGRGIIGTLGVTFNNFSLRNLMNPDTWSPLPQGDGQRLSLRAQTNGKFFQSYNFSLTEPWLGGKKPNSFTVSGFHSRSTNGQDIEASSFSRLVITGGSLSLGTRLKKPDDYFVSSTSLSYQNLNLISWSGFTLDNGQRLDDGTYHNLSFNQVFSRNSIDSPIFPTSGANLQVSLQFTPPYSLFRKDGFYLYNTGEKQGVLDEINALKNAENPEADDFTLSDAYVQTVISNRESARKFKFAEYHKLKIKAEWYSKLFAKMVVKTSAKIGMLGGYDRELGVTPFERFELGGDGIANYNIEGKDIVSLRGYNTTDLLANNLGGATIFDKFTVELRYPVSLNPQATIYVLGFVEGGNAWKQFRDFNPLELKRSAGLGLRVFLPMFGTLGFDYGIGFDKELSSSSRWLDYGRFNIVLGIEPE